MKRMRAMQRAYSPRICAETQQKDGHQKTIIAQSATAGRRPTGVVFLAGLNARHDRFLLPTFAPLIPHLHTRRACARRLCAFGAGKRASRRAPTGKSRLHDPRRITEGPVQNRAAILRSLGWVRDELDRLERALDEGDLLGLLTAARRRAGVGG